VATAGVTSDKISSFQRVVDFAFVFFCDVEYEWSKTRVTVVSVLFPRGCASDGNYDACACFADLYG